MFAGQIGVYTGMKDNAFAIALNERNPKLSQNDFFVNLQYLFNGTLTISQTARKILE